MVISEAKLEKECKREERSRKEKRKGEKARRTKLEYKYETDKATVWGLNREGQKILKRVMVSDVICVSYSFYVVFHPILAPIPNFIQIGRKTQLKIFNNLVGFGWLGY